MRITLPTLLLLAGCGAEPGESEKKFDERNELPTAQENESDRITISKEVVEQADRDALNEWVKEQDRLNPPAPSVALPDSYTDAECLKQAPGRYVCKYKSKFDDTVSDQTRTFVKSRTGWKIEPSKP